MYLLGALAGILSSHLLDKGDGFSREAWLAALGCRLPFPVAAKQFPMPAQDGVWLDDMQSRLPKVS